MPGFPQSRIPSGNGNNGVISVRVAAPPAVQVGLVQNPMRRLTGGAFREGPMSFDMEIIWEWRCQNNTTADPGVVCGRCFCRFGRLVGMTFTVGIRGALDIAGVVAVINIVAEFSAAGGTATAQHSLDTVRLVQGTEG